MIRGVWFFLAMACAGAGADEATKGLDGEFVEQVVPRAVYPGKPVVISLKFRNTGSAPWEGDAVVLYPQTPKIRAIWGRERIPLVARKSVAPGAVGTFTVQAVSPKAAGTYAFQWKLQDELRGPFGGSSTASTVRVVPSDWLSKVYPHLIGRAATGADQIQFLGMLQREPDLHRYLVHLLLHSERADRMVQAAYRRFLGRGPTPTEVSHWRTHLFQVGMNGLRRELALSPDCYQHFGGTNHRYLTALYESFGEPLPTADAIEERIQGLEAAGGRERLVDELTASIDTRRFTVESWYAELFPTLTPVPAELEEWARLLDPQVTKVAEEVLASFYETYSQGQPLRAVASEPHPAK